MLLIVAVKEVFLNAVIRVLGAHSSVASYLPFHKHKFTLLNQCYFFQSFNLLLDQASFNYASSWVNILYISTASGRFACNKQNPGTLNSNLFLSTCPSFIIFRINLRHLITYLESFRRNRQHIRPPLESLT